MPAALQPLPLPDSIELESPAVLRQAIATWFRRAGGTTLPATDTALDLCEEAVRAADRRGLRIELCGDEEALRKV